MKTYKLKLTNISCGSCVGRAERAVATVNGVQSFTVNLATHDAQLALESEKAFDSVINALEQAGYPAIEHPSVDQPAGMPNWKNAAALSLPLIVIEMSRHGWPGGDWLPEGWTALWNTAQWVLATLVLAWPARKLMTDGIQALKRLAPDMNALVLLGAGSAWGFSTWAWLTAKPYGLYFESAAVICTLILLGRHLEESAKNRTGDAIRGLNGLVPKQARVWRQQRWTTCLAAEVNTGDRVQIPAGEALPADGRLNDADAWLNESLLTGESVPVAKRQGDELVGGAINAGQSPIEMTTTATGQNTVLANIVAMVERAQSTRLPIQRLINQVTFWFVPVVLCLAALSLAYWWPVSGLEKAWVTAISVLIIACPCAMGLATPTSIAVGMGRAARDGILFRRGDALEQLSRVRTVAFDKTGTLTEGQPSIIEFYHRPAFDPNAVHAAVSALEKSSTHPLARALDQHAPAPMSEIQQISGCGIQGVDGLGRHWMVGKLEWIADDIETSDANIPTDHPHTLVTVACDGELAGWYLLADPIRPTARSACDQLKSQGYRLAMLSGDRDGVARRVADDLGIPDVRSQLSPASKLTEINRLARPIAFVGDGINDAPALTQADVGVAIGTGSQIAIDSADVVLMGADPAKLALATHISRATLRNIHQNLFWAFGYNVALIPIAMGAWGFTLSPMLAAGAMALSSVCVVLNALRLRSVQPEGET